MHFAFVDPVRKTAIMSDKSVVKQEVAFVM
jgi:hypothetical protein